MIWIHARFVRRTLWHLFAWRGAATLVAGTGLGPALSLAGDPALWITGVVPGAAALERTGILSLGARGQV